MTARVGLLTLPAWVPGFIPEDVRPPCRDVDPELFFPLGDHYDDKARDVCHRCPVEEACGQWAMDTGQEFGPWGGLDPTQRKARRRAWELRS